MRAWHALLAVAILLATPRQGAAQQLSPAPDSHARDAVAAQFAAYVATVDEAARLARAAAVTAEERSLVEAELAFAADARARGLAAAFAAHWARDGVFFLPGAPLAVGPEAVAKALAGDRSDVRWAPLRFVVSGDLGVTWGPTAWLIPLPGGDHRAMQGRFVTTWKRNEAGVWKVWTDIGNFGPVTLSPAP
jgi:ketosteroid isomerase-like protein